MADPMVRWMGSVEDIDGATLVVGVDYDTVNVDGRRLNSAQTEAFAKLFVQACWQASANAAQMAAEDMADRIERDYERIMSLGGDN